MNSKTEAIVLRAIKYGEQKMIVHMFTREHGRLSFVATLPRSARAKLKKQYFQPLTLLYIESDVRQNLQLQKLADAALLAPLPSLLGDASKLAISLFVSEFLYYALRDEQQNGPLFDYVRSSIEWLDACPSAFANFHLVFLMRLSRFLGFFPNLEEVVRGERRGERIDRAVFFDLRAACFTATAPLHCDFLMPEEADHIRLLMRMDFPTMHLFRLSQAQRRRILEILLLYYRLHMPQMPDLRSVEVLQELFAD